MTCSKLIPTGRGLWDLTRVANIDIPINSQTRLDEAQPFHDWITMLNQSKMQPITKITGNPITNAVEQLVSFLEPGDIFRKPLSRTQYKFDELKLNERLVICENLDTHEPEQIYCNSPVYKLILT